MKQVLKGVMVILITIGLFALSQAYAGTERELKKLLEGKQTVYQGTCHLNERGLFRDKEEAYTVHRCIIGVDYSEEGDIYYVLLFEAGNKPVKLLRVNKDTTPATQDVLWTNKTEV